MSATDHSENAFATEVANRLGVMPNFFCSAAAAPGLIEELWAFATSAYLRSPLPSLFKERLFVHLSRFCEVRYCIVRHLGFLIGQGRPAGDADARPDTIEQALALLRRAVPDARGLGEALVRLEDQPSLIAIPESRTQTENDLFDALTIMFLEPRQSQRARNAVRRAFGDAWFEILGAFLAFVGTAHFWTEIHPEIAVEPDMVAVMERHPDLARLLLDPSEAERARAGESLRQAVTDLQDLKQSLHETEERYRALFDATQSPYLVLAADAPRFTITDVNNAYLRATMTEREALVGHGVFEAFPNDPDDPNAIGVRDLNASFERTLATRQTDTIAVLKYDIRRPDGTFEERYWNPVNTPILNRAGEPINIIHHAEDVTGYIRLLKRGAEADRLEADVIAAGKRLQQANDRLRASEERQALLLTLSDTLRPLADPITIQEEASRLLGRHLGVSRVLYAEFKVEDGREYAVIERDYHAADAASSAGRHPAESFQPDIANLRAGRAMVVSDTGTELAAAPQGSWRALGVRAYIGLPLFKDGRLAAGFGVHSAEPRSWTAEEIALVGQVAERTWAAVERARAEEHRELLINELNHRVKNTLATVQSFASQTLRNAKSTAEARTMFESRLMALAKAHDVLTREHWTGADLRDVVADAIAAYSESERAPRFHVGGPGLRLQPKSALALAMALHELATNAVKYGALSNETGAVEIEWQVSRGEQRRFRLRWTESGGPPVEQPRQRGFGSRLVEQGLAHDLAGEVLLDFEQAGLKCVIEAPLAEITGDGSRYG